MGKINDILCIIFSLLTVYYIICGHIDLATFCMVNSVHMELLRKETK